jgi:hemolysin activation/secretion protein
MSMKNLTKGLLVLNRRILLLIASMCACSSQAQPIKLAGATALSDTEIKEVVEKYKSLVVEAEDIAAVVNALNKLYRDKGFVNSGVIYGKQVSSAEIVLQAVEGSLNEINILGDGSLSTEYISGVIRSEVSSPLNLEDLQRAFNRLERNNNIKAVRGKLEPGSSVGHSYLDLEIVESDPFSMLFRVNNYRSPSVGSEQAQMQLSHINLTGRSDILNLGLNLTEGLTSGSVSYSIPLTTFKSRLGVFYSQGENVVIEEPFEEIDIESETDTVGLNLETLFVDTSVKTISTTIGIEKKTSQSSLLGLPFDFSPGSVGGETEATVFSLSARYQHRSKQQALSAKLTYRQGLDAWNATILPDDLADGEFSLWQVQMTYIRLLTFFDADMTFSVVLNSQFTNDSLQSFERFALGGRESIRGFRENQVLRDKAWSIRTQLEIPVSGLKNSLVSLGFYPFVDIGKGKNARFQSNVRQTIDLSSLGLGFNLDYRQLRVSIEWAKRLAEKEKQDDRLQDNGIHIGFSYVI